MALLYTLPPVTCSAVILVMGSTVTVLQCWLPAARVYPEFTLNDSTAHKNLHLEREEIVIAHDPDVMMENVCQLGHGHPAQVQNSWYSCTPDGHVGAEAKQRMWSHKGPEPT